MKRLLVTALAIVCLFLGIAITSTASPRGSSSAKGPLGHRRIERFYRYSPPWESSCDGDACGVEIIFALPASTPRSTNIVDVSLTVTLDYKTSADDYAKVYAGIFRSVGGRRVVALHPGWPVSSSSDTYTSTTLTWVKRGLPASGRDYSFQVSAPTREGSGDDASVIRGRAVRAVIEIWPAGP